MPINKQYLVECYNKMQKAIAEVSSYDEALAKSDPLYAKKLLVRMVVEPVASGGFDFNSSVYQLSKKITLGTLPSDPEHRLAIISVFTLVYQASNHLLSYQYITKDTRVALEEALQALQKKLKN
jgi:hypothetical protein